jgi:hypothetical protein
VRVRNAVMLQASVKTDCLLDCLVKWALPGSFSLMPVPLGLGSLGDAVGHALRPPDLHSLFPNMTARDLILKFTANTYGPGMAKALSARLGPMDDPVRLMAQRAIDQPSGNIPIGGTTPPGQ